MLVGIQFRRPQGAEGTGHFGGGGGKADALDGLAAEVDIAADDIGYPAELDGGDDLRDVLLGVIDGIRVLDALDGRRRLGVDGHLLGDEVLDPFTAPDLEADDALDDGPFRGHLGGIDRHQFFVARDGNLGTQQQGQGHQAELQAPSRDHCLHHGHFSIRLYSNISPAVSAWN